MVAAWVELTSQTMCGSVPPAGFLVIPRRLAGGSFRGGDTRWVWMGHGIYRAAWRSKWHCCGWIALDGVIRLFSTDLLGLVNVDQPTLTDHW